MKANTTSKNIHLENYAPRIIALGLLATCLLLLLTGCKQKTAANVAPSPTPDPTGVYALVSVDGQPVPCNINHEGTAMTVQSGSYAITAYGRCTCIMVISVGSRKDMTVVTHASFQQAGAELTMTWEGAGTTTGKLTGNTFTMDNEGMAFAYRK